MKTNLKFTLPLMAIAATTLYSCADSADSWFDRGEPDPSKELMAFSSQDGQVTTRAYMEGTRAGLDANNETKIVMRIKSEDTQTSEGHTAGENRFTRTVATASKEMTSDHGNEDNGYLIHNELSATHYDVSFAGQDYYRYWDDAYGRYAKLSVYAVAVPGKNDNNVLSDEILAGIAGCSGSEHNVTYISTGAAKVSDTNPYWFTETTENNVCDWEVPTEVQTNGTNQEKDLCYSNNIKNGGEKGIYRFKYASGTGWSFDAIKDGQMIWHPSENGSTIGKFDQGNLIFKHALCKITINLTEGNGFNNSDNSDFKFKSGTNVELLGFNYKGKLNVETGTWSNLQSETISKLEEKTAATPAPKTVRTVTGLTLPERILKDDRTNNKNRENALHFVIDDNDYYVTCDQIASAIQTYYSTGDGQSASNADELKTFTTMKQGHHYVINITVSKTKIDNITAQLIGWEEVNSANIDPTNAYISVNLEERQDASDKFETYDSDDANKFSIYRKASKKDELSTSYTSYIDEYNNFVNYEWSTGYTTDGAATKDWNPTDSKWSTGWYWPNNLTYYHLRVAGNTDATTTGQTPEVKEKDSNVAAGDYFEIKGGPIDATGNYKDYIWGAPFTNIGTKGDGSTTQSAKFVYSVDNGFDKQTIENDKVTWSQIYKAIGPTNNKINMMLFHMTSQVNFEVKTTRGTDKVDLITGDGNTDATRTKVEILRFYQNGTVLMGNGKVDITGNLTTNQVISYGTHTQATTTDGAKSTFSYGVVPQTLERTGGTTNDYKVGLRITTPDGNQYVIQDISTVFASVTSVNLANPYTEQGSGNNADKFKINRWYPGYKYTYTVTLTKTGIKSITAQLVDWEEVKGNLGNITLEGTN